MRIEHVFGRNQADARVTHGSASPQRTQFQIQGRMDSLWQRVQALKRDLTRSLGVSDVAVSPTPNGAQLDVIQSPAAAVPLLALLEREPRPPSLQATLGLAEDGKPVRLDLTAEDLQHALIVGAQAAGKTSLLQSIAVSLALTNRQAYLQMAVLDPQVRGTHPGGLRALNYIPHLLMPVITDVSTSVEALQFLVEEADYRIQHNRHAPLILVLIDRLELLLHGDAQTTRRLLTQLLQKGADAHIYVVVAARSARADLLDNLLKSYLGVRLVGQVPDETEAHAATGLRNSYAEQLLGKGEFAAVSGGKMTYFQGAYLAEHEMLWALQQMEQVQRRTPRLLAQPHVIRPNLAPQNPVALETPFVVRNGELMFLDESRADARTASDTRNTVVAEVQRIR